MIATWNVRSLVENAGDERICRKRPNEALPKPNTVDCKLDLLVRELRRYNVSVGAVQETKWFGSDIWQADGYTLLHSGRPLPGDSESAARKEGVGILLDEKATNAWRAAGEAWEATSSRIISARLKIVRVGQRIPGGSRETSNTFATVISVYAPTAKAPSHVKQKFYEDLQSTVDKVPVSDVMILLGDFNSRVGRREVESDLWRGTLGIHGLEERNEAGEEFLEFCASNQLTIMNTWFKKKEIYLGTWMHPATKKHHMIDFIVMREGQRMFCTDVKVMRGANCWSDHRLVRAKLRINSNHSHSNKRDKPAPFAVHKLRDSAYRDRYRESLTKHLTEAPHNVESTAENSWEFLKSCIWKAGEEILGRERKTQPDWFQENAEYLKPIIESKNRAHNQMIRTNSVATRKEFRRQQRIVKSAVDRAKEEWIKRIASEGEKAKKDGRTRWESIRKLQTAHAGRRSSRSTAILKEDGELTKNPEEVRSRWYRHFSNILNIPSEYCEAVVDNLPPQPIRSDLDDDPPTDEELESALNKLKLGKAGGKTGIAPELVVHGGADLWDRMLELMREIWKEKRVVEDWKDAEIVPIPKKGNLQSCDNWRGISLLDVAGKVFARIIQERLQIIAESVLPDSQCGFRKNRGCVDMIFTSRQLVEKTLEHDDSLFVLFVDLKKAYDSVPRNALWKVLGKVGVPPTMLQIIKSFHDGMKADVRVGATSTDSIEVKNGLRQGCTLAPTLFNIYYSVVVSSWRDKCPLAGVNVRFKHGRKLVGDRTAKSRLNVVKITESQFADDTATYATSRDAFEHSTTEFVRTAKDWGMTVSIDKTKGMVIGKNVAESDVESIQTGSGAVEVVDSFPYLGSIVASDGDVTSELSARIAKAARAFGCLRKPIFQNSNLSLSTKRAVYRAMVMSVLLYGAETWTIKANHVKRLRSFHNRCIRSILGITRYQQWKERITSKRLAAEFGMEEPIEDTLMLHRLKWLGHLGRMDPDRIPKIMLFGELEKTRPRHGTKKRWRDGMKSDLQAIGVAEWYNLSQNRPEWLKTCVKGVEQHRKTVSESEANRHVFGDNSIDNHQCPCGRVFRCKGDLTRHRRFCDSEGDPT